MMSSIKKFAIVLAFTVLGVVGLTTSMLASEWDFWALVNGWGNNGGGFVGGYVCGVCPQVHSGPTLIYGSYTYNGYDRCYSCP
jgi:hypothetical protein